MSRPIEVCVHDLLTWLEKQRLAYADMVTDGDDASIWCKEEAEKIADHAQTVICLNELRLLSDEADFLRHEGGPQSVAAMEAALKATIPVMRRTAAEYLESVMIRHNPDTIAPSEWAEIAADLDAILAAEAVVGRLDDDDRDRLWLNPILDAGQWRAVLGDAGQREGS